MTNKTKQLIDNIPRLKDFYEVGPVQRAAVEDLVEAIIRECAETVQDFADHRFPASEYSDRLKRYFGIE